MAKLLAVLQFMDGLHLINGTMPLKIQKYLPNSYFPWTGWKSFHPPIEIIQSSKQKTEDHTLEMEILKFTTNAISIKIQV